MIFYSQDSRVLLDTEVDDNSYRHRAIMGDHNITLHYSLAEHVELPVGACCLFDGRRYTLERPEAFTMKHSRNFEYTVTMESVEAKAKIYKFRNPVDGRLKFTLTAKPKEHLQMFVDNMNRRDSGWTVGDGSFYYRWNIGEAQPVGGEESSAVQWQCEEVTVWSPVTANKITEAVITSKWDNNYEQKLVNDYNAAKLGIYGADDSIAVEERITAYTGYLSERKALKEQVDADCAELGIL